MARRSAFDGEVLRQALQATFGRRQIPLPTDAPLALTPLFVEDRVKQAQWAAFLRKSRLAAPDLTLDHLSPLLRVSSPGGIGCGAGIAISGHLDAGRTLAHQPTLVWQRLTGSMDTQDAVARSTTMVLSKSVSGRGPARVLYTARYA